MLKEDIYSQNKINARLESINESKLKEKFDVIIMRYVLNYNSFDVQFDILNKVKNVLKKEGIFFLHHCGSVNKEHRDKLNKLFSTEIVSKKLVRINPYWSTWKEMLLLLKKAGFESKILEHYQIPVGDLYKKRNGLNDAEEKGLHDYLGKYDFIDYTIFENIIK